MDSNEKVLEPIFRDSGVKVDSSCEQSVAQAISMNQGDTCVRGGHPAAERCSVKVELTEGEPGEGGLVDETFIASVKPIPVSPSDFSYYWGELANAADGGNNMPGTKAELRKRLKRDVIKSFATKWSRPEAATRKVST